MNMSGPSSHREKPERLVRRLAARLSRHVLWDSLLLFVPPALALIYIVALFFQAAWLSARIAAAAAIAVAVLGGLAVYFRRRPLVPGMRTAARLIDRQSGAKDHFLTLASVDPANQPEAFLARLRRQAGGFLDRVDLKRNFPYRFKSSAYWSLGGSLLAASLIHLLLPLGLPGRDAARETERLRELAQQMAVNADLRALARELEATAAQLDDPKLSAEEKQALARQLEEKIQDQQKKQEQKDDQDLLAQAASALSGHKPQDAAGGQQEKEQQKGAGGIQSNARQDGQGQGKQGEGGSGEGKDESGAQLSQGMDQGKSSQANNKERGQDKNPAGGEKDNQSPADPNQPDSDPDKDKPGKTQGGAREGGGRQQASADPPPQGGSPAERFYKPGEGKEGLKGAGYVTVQLPEEVVADTKGESRPTKDSKNSRTRTQIPLSNVPLPSHVPNAPTEKQPLPIEYRGIIR